jgi:two-component system, cell cycle response regulator DivK
MSAHILVVDDHPINLRLTAELLEFSDFRVTRTRDAEAALAAIRVDPPQLVLLDLQLPGMGGLELVRLLRRELPTNRLRLIALSAFAMKADIQQALEAGCDGYITKPIDADTFPAQVESYLAGDSP